MTLAIELGSLLASWYRPRWSQEDAGGEKYSLAVEALPMPCVASEIHGPSNLQAALLIYIVVMQCMLDQGFDSSLDARLSHIAYSLRVTVDYSKGP